MTISKSCIFSVFFFTFICTTAQIPEVQWKKCYGGTQIDYAKALAIDEEGFLYLCGSTSSTDIHFEENNGSYDCAIIKVNQEGDVIWSKTFGGSETDRLNDIIITSDSNIIAVGYTYSNDFDVIGNKGAQDVWVLKLNLVGDILWQKCYGGTSSDEAMSVLELPDGNIIIGAESKSLDGDLTINYGLDDIWIFKIDINGSLIWQKTIGGSQEEDLEAMKIINTNSIIISGASRSNDFDIEFNFGFHDALILELNIDGVLLNVNTFGSNKTDKAQDVILAANNSIVFAGDAGANNFDVIGYNGGVSDYWVAKSDTFGNIIWQVPLGGSNDEMCYSMNLLIDSSIILVGESTSNNGDVSLHYGSTSTSDVWLVSLNQNGDVQFDTTFGGTENDAAYDILVIDSFTYFILGHTASSDFDVTDFKGIQDMWLIKVGPQCSTQVYYADFDGDGYGNLLVDSTSCELPTGYVSDSTDCNDLNSDIHPTLTDICNSIDDNCNDLTDEDAIFVTYYLDTDGDLFGDAFTDTTSCSDVTGYVENNLDCIDLNPEINPLMSEICNAIDDNCNIEIDEGLIIYTLYADTDGDTYGNLDATIDTCLEVVTGYVNNNLDCNDSLATIYPGATELCNYLDDDCDGIADDNLTYLHSYQDADNDNFGNPFIDSLSCELPTGYVSDSTDCDDTNPDVYPGAVEILNGLDDDCNGLNDDGVNTIDNFLTEIKIYPNPTDGLFTIVLPEKVNIDINIRTIDGKLIFLKSVIDTEIIVINLTQYAAGLYFVELQNEIDVAIIQVCKN